MSAPGTEYLRHILAEAEYLARTAGALTREAFLADETLKRAFVRSIEVIGEAAKKLPDSWRDDHPTIDWRAMAGMRDRLIHGYFGVDYEIVWDVASTRAPDLCREIPKLLSEPEA